MKSRQDRGRGGGWAASLYRTPGLAGAGGWPRGFSLIEMMIVIVIISLLLMWGINEYIRYVAEARLTRAKADLEELLKAVRIYNLQEDSPFQIGTFTPQYLGSFVGVYLEKSPPLDPWGNPYLHFPELGIVYSRGPDGIDGIRQGVVLGNDDVIARYLPQEFFITKAEYVDENRNNQIDFGDSVEITFSRLARISNLDALEFETESPPRAFGSAEVVAPTVGKSLRIVFAPPLAPSLRMGETVIRPRPNRPSITDFAVPPQSLTQRDDVVIKRKRQ